MPVLLALSVLVVPDGASGIRVGQHSGVGTGTLYPGVHMVTPLVDNVARAQAREGKK